jgi:hypothetical protein
MEEKEHIPCGRPLTGLVSSPIINIIPAKFTENTENSVSYHVAGSI